MSKDPNQKQDTPEDESYKGILGDYQEQPDATEQATDSEHTDSVEIKKSGKALKIAGVSVVSAALIGCLGFLGVRLWSNQSDNQENLTSQNSQSDQTLNQNSSTLPENPDAAVYSENLEVSPALMECFYKDYLSQFESAFSYYGIDADVSLKEQMLPEDAGENISWFDYIMRQTKASVSQLLVFNEAANAAGYVMTEEDKQTLEDAIANTDMSTYGDNVSEDDVRTMLEMEILASSYFSNVLENMEITDDQLDAYYQEHRTEFDTCGLAGFSVSYDTAKETDASDTTEATQEEGMSKEQAEELAENLKNAKSPEEFESLVHDILVTYENYTEEELTDALPTIYNNNFAYTESFDVSDWAFAEDTKVNDTFLTENDGYISVYMLTREASLDETDTVNVRHILFSTSNHIEELAEDADETAKEEANEKALQTCRKLAEDALAEWENGDKTEDSFAELANSQSEDPGSNTKGGLYENVYTGQMVTSFNDWCFDSSRNVGDTGIVETSYGVHVMYFSGKSEPLWKNNARNALKSDNMDNWYAEQQAVWAVNSNDEILNAIGD